MKTINIFIIAVLILSLTGGVVVASSKYMFTEKVSNVGSVKTNSDKLRLYNDADGTKIMNSILWGTLSPNENRSVTIYVKNTLSIPLVLKMITGNFTSPEAQKHISITWDRENCTINSDIIYPAILTIHVSPDCSDIPNFGYDMSVIGTG